MGGAQAAFGRFWVAGRIGSWSVLVFGAKWIISGRRRVRCGRPACITNTCLWHNLRLMHRFEDYRGTRIINPYPSISFPSSTRGKVALTRAT